MWKYKERMSSVKRRTKWRARIMESSSTEEGYQGAWFECRVINRAGEKWWTVEYQDFVGNQGEPLVEVVPSSHLRPVPPEKALPDPLSVGDSVEAYESDCWWRGMIVNMHEVENIMMHSVYFPDTRTFGVYTRSKLRLGQDWIDGKWIHTKWTCTLQGKSFEENSQSPELVNKSTDSKERQLEPQSGKLFEFPKRRRVYTDFIDVSVTAHKYEVVAYVKILRVLVKKGMNRNRMSLLEDIAAMLNITPAEQQEFYTMLKVGAPWRQACREF